MGLFRLLRREFLGQFGLLGRALNERMDRGGADDEADREPRSYSPAGPDDDILYQVLSPAGTIWQTQYIGSDRDDASGMVVATNLKDLQRQFPAQQARAVMRDGRLIDIRT